MSERKLQKVGYSTLTISIPAAYAKQLKLRGGDSIVIREEGDGTLRLIPVSRANKKTKASIKADLVDNEELLSKLVIGCYVLGYDEIEIVSKNGIKSIFAERASRTMKRLRGVEIVESSKNRILAQSFMDPAKFPVDSLIRRLQLLVSTSLEAAVEALKSGTIGLLNSVRKSQEEIDELYWLIVRQLLVAFGNRELSGRMGLESPLHTSGDRVSAKTVEEIGRIILELTEEIINLKETGIKLEESVMKTIETLARKTQETFEKTMESLLTPDIRTIGVAGELVTDTLQLQREVMLELVETGEHSYLKTIIAHLGQLVRYCNIIIEIALNRLLRKTSRVCVIQEE